MHVIARWEHLKCVSTLVGGFQMYSMTTKLYHRPWYLYCFPRRPIPKRRSASYFVSLAAAFEKLKFFVSSQISFANCGMWWCILSLCFRGMRKAACRFIIRGYFMNSLRKALKFSLITGLSDVFYLLASGACCYCVTDCFLVSFVGLPWMVLLKADAIFVSCDDNECRKNQHSWIHLTGLYMINQVICSLFFRCDSSSSPLSASRTFQFAAFLYFGQIRVSRRDVLSFDPRGSVLGCLIVSTNVLLLYRIQPQFCEWSSCVHAPHYIFFRRQLNWS